MHVFLRPYTWITGIAIFSMFFGAGNVVFPLTLGFFSGDKIQWAILGLCITAIGGPLIGLFAATLYEGNCRHFFYRVGQLPGNCLIILALSLLGPFAVMPRCFIVAYEAVKTIWPGLTLLNFSVIAALTILAAISKREWVLKILGYFLSPILIISLLVIIFLGLFHSQPLAINEIHRTVAFKQGLLVGYDTMDLMAAIFFATPIWYLLKSQLNIQTTEDKVTKLIPVALASSLIGGLILGGIYLGLSIVSALHVNELSQVPPAGILSHLSIHLLGERGAMISNIAIALACMTTVMSLTVMIIEVLTNDFKFWDWLPKHPMSHTGVVVLIMMITVILTNLGFSQLMAIIHPIVTLCYPAIIVLTLCNILYKLFGFKWVKAPFWFTLLITGYCTW